MQSITKRTGWEDGAFSRSDVDSSYTTAVTQLPFFRYSFPASDMTRSTSVAFPCKSRFFPILVMLTLSDPAICWRLNCMKERQSNSMMCDDAEVVQEQLWLQMLESMAWCSWCGSMHWFFEVPSQKFSVNDVIVSVEHILMPRKRPLPPNSDMNHRKSVDRMYVGRCRVQVR